jgi:predicted metal-dependent hydrolase
MLLIEGREIRVVGTPDGRGAVCDGVTLTVNQARSGPAAKAFLTNLARDRLTAASDKYAERIGHRFRAITLRDTRSRWGSCTAERRLMYSWRLAMAPADVLDYVAAHEVAHLEHMDHSADFWRAVAQLCPNYESHRTWLRENGPSLHRFVFTD